MTQKPNENQHFLTYHGTFALGRLELFPFLFGSFCIADTRSSVQKSYPISPYSSLCVLVIGCLCQLVSPGAWLTEMSQERYEVREKKTTKKVHKLLFHF